MAKDAFGFGTEWGSWISKEHQIEPEVIEAVEKDFGDRFGSDLSLLVLEHYKSTGELLATKDIGIETLKALQDKYMDNLFPHKQNIDGEGDR